MKNAVIRFLLFAVFIIATFSTCVDPFTVVTNDHVRKLVVDGGIVNAPGSYTIKLYYSEPYNDKNTVPVVNIAKVYVVDDLNNRYDFDFVERGTYRSDPLKFEAQAGRTYTLHISLPEGTQYVSRPQLLKEAPPIDTVYAQFVQQSDSRGIVSEFFNVFTEMKDSVSKGDFYRWSWAHYDTLTYCLFGSIPSDAGNIFTQSLCCEPCWEIERCRSCINIANDFFTNGNTIRQRITNIPFDSEDDYFVVVEQYRISEEEYRFWQIADGQINNAGGIFDNPPATIPGNVYNPGNPEEQVLGFFSVAGLRYKSAYLNRNVAESNPKIISVSPPRITTSFCDPCSESTLRTKIEPPGWRR